MDAQRNESDQRSALGSVTHVTSVSRVAISIACEPYARRTRAFALASHPYSTPPRRQPCSPPQKHVCAATIVRFVFTHHYKPPFYIIALAVTAAIAIAIAIADAVAALDCLPPPFVC
ncbi:unnamed protein product, partial [Iphiclides podalirius]